MTFGERLKAARKAAGMSQTELAAGRYSLSYVSHLESGRRAPTPELASYFERRLGLEQGTLSAGEVPLSRHRVTAADTTALYLNAQSEWREGAAGRALEQAQEALKQAESLGHNELRWMALELLINVELDLGHYDDAADHATELVTRAERLRSSSLIVRAQLIASKTARRAGRKGRAVEYAKNAVLATSDLPEGNRLRVLALSDALAANPNDTTHVEELTRCVNSMDNGHTLGIAAWTLGNIALSQGHVEEGLALHNRSQQTLSPSTDFRNWERFPRASAYARLNAGVTEGVPELIERSKVTLPLSNNPDEYALLAYVEAAYNLAMGNPQVALDRLREELQKEDIPTDTMAELHLLAAHAQRTLQDDTGATASAMEAARLFTEADELDQAKRAWAFLKNKDATPAAGPHIEMVTSGDR